MKNKQICKVNASEFIDALTKINKALKNYREPFRDVLQLRFDSTECLITGMNYNDWIKIKIPASGGALTFIAYDSKAILKLCRHFSEYITFELSEGNKTFVMMDEKRTATGYCDVKGEFPPVPEFEALASYKVNAKILTNRISKVRYAVSNESDREIYIGICFKDDMLIAVNGYCMAINRDEAFNLEGEFTLPVKPTNTLDLFGDEDLQIEVSQKYATFKSRAENIIFSVKTTEEKFLNIGAIIPRDSDIKDTYSVNTVEYIKDMMTKKVKEYIKFENGHLNIETNRGYFSANVNICGNSSIVYGFNCDYMLDTLKQLRQSQIITIKIFGNIMPIVFTDGKNDYAIVLPVRLNEQRMRTAAYDHLWKCSHDILITKDEFMLEAGEKSKDTAGAVYDVFAEFASQNKLSASAVYIYAHFRWCLNDASLIVAYRLERNKWLLNSCSAEVSIDEAKACVNKEWGFETGRIEIIGTPCYDATNYQFIRFDCGHMRWLWNGGYLYQVYE